MVRSIGPGMKGRALVTAFWIRGERSSSRRRSMIASQDFFATELAGWRLMSFWPLTERSIFSSCPSGVKKVRPAPSSLYISPGLIVSTSTPWEYISSRRRSKNPFIACLLVEWPR
jgi:hypothetical protein